MSFSGKVVVVTGSSSGIGAAAAIRFTEEGAQVVITGRNQVKLGNVYEQCASLGLPPLMVTGDISNEEDAKRLIDETIRSFGKIDVLVNNAGILRMATVQSDQLMQSFDEVISTNLRPVVHLTGLVAPHLIEAKGNIVNISSIGATKVLFGMSCYALSKAAVNHFSRIAALELSSSGVRVNTISPGPVMTDIFSNSGLPLDELMKTGVSQRMSKRISTPDEVANLALYLAGEKAVGITGADFVLDNGTLLA